MAESKKPVPKGGSRGGTRYPHLDLSGALQYAEKLVRKTHSGPQPEQTILIGVFDNKGPAGKVRASALKQYGLLEGDTTAYTASELARQIEAAQPEEKPKFYRKAFLSAKLFSQIFQTLQGDTVTRARIRQVSISEKVHPDSADESVEYFVQGATKCGLGTTTGEDLKLIDAKMDAGASAPAQAGDNISEEPIPELPEPSAPPGGSGNTAPKGQEVTIPPDLSPPGNPATKQAGISVHFNLDSSLDTDKLARQLELLRKFNVI